MLVSNDHADVLNGSYFMECVQVVYDRALHLTDSEYKEKFGREVDVQAEVERPHIRMFPLSKATEIEQLSLVPDRLRDTHCCTTGITPRNGEPIEGLPTRKVKKHKHVRTRMVKKHTLGEFQFSSPNVTLVCPLKTKMTVLKNMKNVLFYLS